MKNSGLLVACVLACATAVPALSLAQEKTEIAGTTKPPPTAQPHPNEGGVWVPCGKGTRPKVIWKKADNGDVISANVSCK
jgi:hypothetical protein